MPTPLTPDDIVYQIFPDRFRNARPELNPREGQWQWKGRPIRTSSEHADLTQGPSDQYTFFGGDLEGIRLSIPHLKSLGVTAIYLTPIFAARSTHRYDAVDYKRIDPALGDRADFEKMAADLHANQMKLVLDGVLNHTSEDHPWHQDVDSRRKYYIMRDGERAMMWMGGSSLPKLDPQQPEVARELLSVLDAWPETDAWRLDAAHLLPQKFVRDVRKHVAPRSIIIEDWNFSRHYFTKGLADSVTNFLFREAIRTYFGEDCSAETLIERFSVWIKFYPSKNAHLCWNFLDNHDTSRLRSAIGRARALRGLIFLYTMPGTPLIYQGTEFGMEGKTAGEARAPLPWDTPDKWDHETLGLVRALGRLRHASPALRTGSFKAVAADNRSRTVVYDRTLGAERVRVVVNDGYHPFRKRIGGEVVSAAPGEWSIRWLSLPEAARGTEAESILRTGLASADLSNLASGVN